MGRPSPLIALRAAASVTSTLRLGTQVLANDFRNPVLLGQEAALLDVLSNGRFELGIGSGWLHFDYDALGAERCGYAIGSAFRNAIPLGIDSVLDPEQQAGIAQVSGRSLEQCLDRWAEVNHRVLNNLDTMQLRHE